MNKTLHALLLAGLSFGMVLTVAANPTTPAAPKAPSAPATAVKPQPGVIVPNANRGNRPQQADDWVKPNDRVDERIYPEDRTEERATEEINKKLIKEE